jgi:hypothetical protein
MNSVDWSSIIDALDNAHQYDGYISASCPFHSDAKPSFFVYSDWFKCLACGANGPTSTLLKRLGKVVRTPNPFPNHVSDPQNPFTRWLKSMTLKQTLKAAWASINDNSGLGNYITRDRGIAEPYRKLLGIGYIDDWYTIPIRNRNGIIISAIARKGRNNQTLSKYVLPYGTNPHQLYVPNWHKVRNARYLIITFGILDAVTLALMGYPAASTISGNHLSPVSVASFRIPIYIIPDRHEESDGLVSAQGLGWRGQCLRMNWPDGCKDINDVWVRDKELCKKLIQGAIDGTQGC